MSGRPSRSDLTLAAYTLLAPASVAVTLAGVVAPGSRSLAPAALALSTGALAVGYRHLSEPRAAASRRSGAEAAADPTGPAGSLLCTLWVAQVLWVLPRSPGGLATAGAVLALILGTLLLLGLAGEYRLAGRRRSERPDWLLELLAAGLGVGLPIAVLVLQPDTLPRLQALALSGLGFGALVRLRALGARRLALLTAASGGRALKAGAVQAAILSGAALGLAALAGGLLAERGAWGFALLASVLAALPSRLPLRRARPGGRRNSSPKRPGSPTRHRVVR